MANVMPDRQQPSRPWGITAHWLVPNYTVVYYLVIDRRVDILPRRLLLESEPTGVEPTTSESRLKSQALYRQATQIQLMVI